jgi:hypothetical protein
VTVLGLVALLSLAGRASAARTTDAWLLADRLAEDAGLSAIEEVTSRLASAACGKSYPAFGLAARDGEARGIPLSPYHTRKLFAAMPSLSIGDVVCFWRPVTDPADVTSRHVSSAGARD